MDSLIPQPTTGYAAQQKQPKEIHESGSKRQQHKRAQEFFIFIFFKNGYYSKGLKGK
jgi:hypothetical protein